MKLVGVISIHCVWGVGGKTMLAEVMALFGGGNCVSPEGSMSDCAYFFYFLASQKKVNLIHCFVLW